MVSVFLSITAMPVAFGDRSVTQTWSDFHIQQPVTVEIQDFCPRYLSVVHRRVEPVFHTVQFFSLLKPQSAHPSPLVAVGEDTGRLKNESGCRIGRQSCLSDHWQSAASPRILSLSLSARRDLRGLGLSLLNEDLISSYP